MKLIFLLTAVSAAALIACEKQSIDGKIGKSINSHSPAKSNAPTSTPENSVKTSETTESSGIPGKEVASCASESNTVKRLDCYDSLASRHGQSPSEVITSAHNKGLWNTKTNTDPLTDSSIYLAFLTAEKGEGRFGEPITLMVRCQNNTTEAYINWNTFLGSDDISVTSRIDKNTAKTSTWSISTDHKASFMPNAATTLKGFYGATSYVANLTPYSESPITAIFNISGAEEALSDVNKGCNWKS